MLGRLLLGRLLLGRLLLGRLLLGRLLLGRLLLFGGTLLGFGLSGQPAHAAEAIDFLDTRPVVIDLDDAEPGQRWRVRLIDLQQGSSEISLHVVFAPAGVITVQDSTVSSSGSGEIVEFVIELDRKLEGMGELVAVSAGGVSARRPISTEFAPRGASLTVDTLQFAGWRIAPFLDQVRIPEIRIPDAPGLVTTGRPLRVGVLTSAGGDAAELVRIGDRFAVDGVDNVGEYTGGTDLLPGHDAGDVEATVRVRDLPAWPLLVLVGGMTIANVLDQYQRRQRPRRLHEWRLARLRERARESQSLTGGKLRITAAREAPAPLLLDHLIDEGRAGFHPHVTDAERASWEPGGDEYERLTATIRDFRQRCVSFRSLLNERDSLIRSADQEDQTGIDNALGASPVAHALRERSIISPAELTDVEQDLIRGRAHLEQFKAIYDLLRTLRRVDSAQVRGAAENLLKKLFARPPDLSELEVESRALLDTWSQRPGLAKRPAAPWILEEQEPAGPVAGHAPPTAAPTDRGAPLRRALIAATGVVATLIVGIVVVSALMLTDGAPPGTDGEAAPTTPARTPTLQLPDAPVAAPAAGLALDGSRADTPSIGQTVWFGVITPVLVLAAGAGLWWLVSSWWRRQFRPQADELDPSKIDHEYRREERRYSILAGILVVLSGMSLLYVGDPTFGTAGDYLAVALWGAAVGEGVQLARRLWPSLPVPGSAP